MSMMFRSSCWVIFLAVVFLPWTALAKLMSFELGPADPSVVENTGQLQFSIPIDVPQGTGGFQPEVRVQYSSATGEGPFGLGWSVPLGEIRITSRFGVPRFDATDAYEFDGELLVETSTPGEYRTLSESFTRIRQVGDQWVAELPTGSVARYGTGEQSRIRRYADLSPDASDGPVVRWLLAELEDTNGNVIKFTYDRSGDAGTAYPGEIQYTYRGGSLVGGIERKIEFLYEDRPDVVFSANGGVRSYRSKRVYEIRSLVDGEVFRRRTFSYHPDPCASSQGTTCNGGSRMLLTGTVVYGTDCSLEKDPATQCTGQPENTFQYMEPRSFGPPPWYGSEQNGYVPVDFTYGTGNSQGKDRGVRFGDVNGDGFVDLIRSDDEPGSERAVYLNNGFSEYNFDQAWTDALEAAAFPAWDIDRKNCSYSPATSHFVFAHEDAFHSGAHWSGGVGAPPQGAVVRDINQDGLADLMASYLVGPLHCADGMLDPKAVHEVWLNTGDPAIGWVRDTAYSDGDAQVTGDPLEPPFFKATGIEYRCDGSLPGTSQTAIIKGCVRGYSFPQGTHFADLNGDQLPDLVSLTAVAYATAQPATRDALIAAQRDGAWINTGNGWRRDDAYLPPHAFLSLASGLAADTGVRLADLNGDGLADMVKSGISVSNISDADAGVFGASGVWMNDSEGWCDTTECPYGTRYELPAAFTQEADSGQPDPPFSAERHYVVSRAFRLIDMNRDGFPDLLYSGPADESGSSPKGFYQDPSGGSAEGQAWGQAWGSGPPGPLQTLERKTAYGLTWYYDTGLRILDADGNGSLDVVRSSEQEGASVELTAFNHPHRLKYYVNGKGARFEVDYGIYRRHSPFEETWPWVEPEPAQEDLSPGIIDLVHNTPVVTALWFKIVPTPDTPWERGVGKLFKYSKPRWCREHRSFLGFHFVHSNAIGGAYSWGPRVETSYWQSHGIAGQVRERHTGSGTNPAILVETFERESVDGGSIPGSTVGAFVGRLTNSSEQKFGYEPLLPSQPPTAGALRSVAYTYDDAYGFNFVSEISIDRPSGGVDVFRTPYPVTPDIAGWRFGLVASATHASGGVVYRQTQTTYTGDGRLLPESISRTVQARGSSSESGASAVVTLTYDEFGNVTSQVDPAGRLQSFCYDGAPGCPDEVEITPGEARVAAATFTVLTGVTDPLQEESEFVRDLAAGAIQHLVRFNGDQAWNESDAFGRPTSLWVQPVQRSAPTLIETRVYHDFDEALGRGYTERFEHVGDGSQILTAVFQDGLGRKNLEVTEVPDGYVVTAADYDSLGRVVTVQNDPTPCISYSHCLQVGFEDEKVRNIAYDALGRLERVDGRMPYPDYNSTPSPIKDLVRIFYSGTEKVQPAGPGAGTLASFDLVTINRGETLTQHVMDGDRLVWTYECSNKVPQAARLPCTDPDVTFHTYEPTGEPREIYDAVATAGGDYSDPAHVLRYSYDTLGRVLSIQDPAGGTTATAYDLVGNVTKTTDARGISVSYAYDALDRITRRTFEDFGWGGSVVNVTYDPVTRLRRSESQENAYTSLHWYDDFGRLEKHVWFGDGRSLHLDFERDLLGRVTRVQYPSPDIDVSYKYEGARLVAVCGLSTPEDCEASPDDYFISDVVYDAMGRVKEIHQPPGIHSMNFGDGRLYRTQFTNTEGEDLVDLSYFHDWIDGQYIGHRLVEVVDAHDTVGTDGMDASATYTYDHRGRIASRTLLGETRYYGYDSLNNLTHRDVLTAPDDAGNPSAPNQLFGDPAHPHRITQSSFSGKTYQYDAAGNMIRRGAQLLSYDHAGRLVCAGEMQFCENQIYYTLDGVPYEYKTNGKKRLVMGDLFEFDPADGTATAHVFAFGRKVATRTTKNAKLRGSFLGAARLWRLPVPPAALGGVLSLVGLAGLLFWLARLGAYRHMAKHPVTAALALVLGVTLVPPLAWAGGANVSPAKPDWVRRWIVPDYHGNAILHVDSSGAAVHRRVFEPFGMVVADSAATEATAQLFTGKRLEASMGLYDFHARWYDAETGHFTSLDPLIPDRYDSRTLNPYSYVGNDPLNMVDPNGLSWASIGEAFSAVGNAIVDGWRQLSTWVGAQVSMAVGVGSVVDAGAELYPGTQDVPHASASHGHENVEIIKVIGKPIPGSQDGHQNIFTDAALGFASFFRGVGRAFRQEARRLGAFGLGEQIQATVIEDQILNEVAQLGSQLARENPGQLAEIAGRIVARNPGRVAGRAAASNLVGRNTNPAVGLSLSALAAYGDAATAVEVLARNGQIFVTTVDPSRPILQQLGPGAFDSVLGAVLAGTTPGSP